MSLKKNNWLNQRCGYSVKLYLEKYCPFSGVFEVIKLIIRKIMHLVLITLLMMVSSLHQSVAQDKCENIRTRASCLFATVSLSVGTLRARNSLIALKQKNDMNVAVDSAKQENEIPEKKKYLVNLFQTKAECRSKIYLKNICTRIIKHVLFMINQAYVLNPSYEISTSHSDVLEFIESDNKLLELLSEYELVYLEQ